MQPVIIQAGHSALKQRIALVSLLIAVLVPAQGAAGRVTDDLKTDIDAIIAVLNDPYLKAPCRKNVRKQLVCRTAARRFDWETMARHVLSSHRGMLTADQMDEFVRDFSRFLQTVYLGRITTFIESMRDFSCRNSRDIEEQVDGPDALVETTVPGPLGETVIGYRLHRQKEAWLVNDVTVDGVWLVDNYRSQCDSILERRSFADLINRIHVKLRPQPGDWQQ